AQQGKFKTLYLRARVENRPLPQVEVIDMRGLKEISHEAGLPHWLSPTLKREIEGCLNSKEQCALFLNRRGFAQVATCPSCGFSESCIQCSVSLTVHGHGSRLECHYCGFQKPMPSTCGHCKQDSPVPFGLGTEKVSAQLQEIFRD